MRSPHQRQLAARSPQGSAISAMEQGWEIFHPGPEVDGARSPCGLLINPNIVIVDIP
jgi:hypothetical protein